jgi:hypothetical protein
MRTELFDTAIVNNGSRVFKRSVDGILAEFASIVDAVRSLRCCRLMRPSVELSIGRRG